MDSPITFSKAKCVFRKLMDHEKIKPSDFHSMDNGDSLNPIMNIDTLHQTPKDFSNERSFWRMTDYNVTYKE